MWLCLLLCVVVLAGRLSVVEGRAAWDDWDDEDSGEKKAEDALPAPAAPSVAEKVPPPPALAPVAPSAISPFVVDPNPASSNSTGGIGLHHSPTSQKLHHANYNETCGFDENSRQCDPAVDMTCSNETKKCICDPSKAAIYVHEEDACLGVATFARQFSCKYDNQCSTGTMGPYSVCNSNTGRCECVKQLGPGREVIKVNDKCVLAKKIGDNCDNDDECDVSIQGHTVCQGVQQEGNLPVVPPNATKECKCAQDYIPDDGTHVDGKNARLCLPVGKEEGKGCRIDAQCRAGIGELSRCFSGACQCADVIAWKGEAVFYQGKCFIKLAVGDECQNDDQCKAGVHSNAECVRHESYLEYDKVCQCAPGKSCDGKDGAGSLIMSVNLILAAIVATRVIP